MDAKRELGQLQAGAFDSLLSSGQVAGTEPSQEKKVQDSGVADSCGAACRPKAQVSGLSKVALQFNDNGDQQTKKSLNLEDLKNAQAEIQ